jgi:hypothetical protein
MNALAGRPSGTCRNAFARVAACKAMSSRVVVCIAACVDARRRCVWRRCNETESGTGAVCKCDPDSQRYGDACQFAYGAGPDQIKQDGCAECTNEHEICQVKQREPTLYAVASTTFVSSMIGWRMPLRISSLPRIRSGAFVCFGFRVSCRQLSENSSVL